MKSKSLIKYISLTIVLLVILGCSIGAFFIVKPYDKSGEIFESEELKYYKSLFKLRLSEDGNEYYILEYKKGKTAKLTIPETIDNIPVTKLMSSNENDFASYSEIDVIEISKNIKYIGIDVNNHESVIYDQPFLQAYGLSKIVVSKENEYFSSIDGVLFSKDLKTLIKYPNSKITDLGYRAYSIPNVVEVIARYAFYLNDQLEIVELGENVRVISKNAFENCKYLESVNMNEKLEIIEESAFARCFELSSIALPKTVTLVEKNAFKKCNKLREITIECENATLEDAFFDILTITNDPTSPDRTEEIIKFNIPNENTTLLDKMTDISFIRSLGFNSFNEKNELLRIYVNGVEGKIINGEVVYSIK